MLEFVILASIDSHRGPICFTSLTEHLPSLASTWSRYVCTVGSKHDAVPHQTNCFTKTSRFVKSKKTSKGFVSSEVGTQRIDRWWRTLKAFLPPRLAAKCHDSDGDSRLSPLVPDLIFQ